MIIIFVDTKINIKKKLFFFAVELPHSEKILIMLLYSDINNVTVQ
jgi:hypothetical protein